MKITDDIILHAIEDSLMLAPHTPGTLEHLDVAGLRGRFSPLLSHPMSNMVTKTRLTPENADATIQSVRDQFAAWNKALGWLVSVSTTPTDMDQRLQTAGFAKTSEFAGMSLDDLDHPIAANPAVRVQRAAKSDDAQISDLYHRAYPLPKAFTDVLVTIRELMGGVDYFAYVEDTDKPVAVASLFYIPDRPIVLLGGAATLLEYRGRGIYTTLVAQRLKVARDEGMQVAVIQADRSSSAPICQKLGFVERCSMELYAWTPTES